MISSLKTAGEYATEQDSEAAIDMLLAGVDHFFKVAREVNGHFWSSRRGHQKVRADRILWPKKPLLELGWNYGVSAIEIKKSGHAAGDVLNQACDYMDAVFQLPDSGVRFTLNQAFLFPGFEECGGTVSSLMAASRIGVAREDRHGRLTLSLNSSSMLSFLSYGEKVGWRVGHNANLRCGWKAGSR